MTQDILEARKAGAGALEYIPFYYYGFGEKSLRRFGSDVPELPDWNEYGFGTPSFVSQFKDALKAARDAEIHLDFAIGPNQGQGVPSEIESPGLAKQLLMGSELKILSTL